MTDRPQATPTVLLDDADMVVTRWDFPPGGETGWHVHGMNYVVTTMTPCPMLVEEVGGGTRQNHSPAGRVYRGCEGAEHNVINEGTEPMSFIELELKKKD
ncbi:cupin [Oceanicella sp. SM1341]|uniref:cupin n=1 Tax=Oceanicella sp. SM1341 TaxID=1548889 RepID=UPI000E5548C7|nr:cupin [Oceanicella sp. SM1341]